MDTTDGKLFDEQGEPLSDAEKSARLLRYIMPDVSIELKIKPSGTYNEYTIQKDLQYLLGDKYVLMLLKQVLKNEERIMDGRIIRLTKAIDGDYPKSIIDHLKKQVSRRKRQINYLHQVIDAMESPNRNTPSYIPPMKRYSYECEDIEDDEA